MNIAKHFLFALVLVLTLSGVAYSQTRGEFFTVEGNFQIAPAVEQNGEKSILVLFPEEYLGSPDKFLAGIKKVLPVIFGCEHFKECVPVIARVGVSADSGSYLVFESLKRPDTDLFAFPLSKKEGEEPSGIKIMFFTKEEQKSLPALNTPKVIKTSGS